VDVARYAAVRVHRERLMMSALARSAGESRACAPVAHSLLRRLADN
jgi:hypothetical protein